MNWIELIVHTTTAGSDAVSSLLIDLGAGGTMTEDRADIPDPSKPHGIWEIIDPSLPDSMPEDVLVHAWLEPSENFPVLLSSLRSRLASLGAANPGYGALTLDTKSIPNENWAENWKKFYKPLRAGDHFVIKPSWEPFDPLPGDRVIEMDPGMAFGSGYHETTSMCLALLERAVVPGARVIDVGTGSGILAIGAAMLGAGQVLAIDIDRDAVRVAEENVRHSGVADLVSVQEGNLLDRVDESCDVCVANIIAQIICSSATPLYGHVVPGGLFICSGIIAEMESPVREALLQAGFEIQDIMHKGEWVAFLSRRPEKG